MYLEDKLCKSILHVPDELVGDANLIRYEDTWWIKQADGTWWYSHEEGEDGEIVLVAPSEHSITGPYLDLTPGMGDALYNPDGTKVEDDAEDEQAED